jgi:serine/threonine protein kinase
MGEVYRARDTKLGRDVAIDFLAQSVTSGPDRLARISREAQVLASLHHPNIAAIDHLEETVDGPAFDIRSVVRSLPSLVPRR